MKIQFKSRSTSRNILLQIPHRHHSVSNHHQMYNTTLLSLNVEYKDNPQLSGRPAHHVKKKPFCCTSLSCFIISWSWQPVSSFCKFSPQALWPSNQECRASLSRPIYIRYPGSYQGLLLHVAGSTYYHTRCDHGSGWKARGNCNCRGKRSTSAA